MPIRKIRKTSFLSPLMAEITWSNERALRTGMIPKKAYQLAKKRVLDFIEKRDKGTQHIEFNDKTPWLKYILENCGFISQYGPTINLFLDKLVAEGHLTPYTIKHPPKTSFMPKEEKFYCLTKLRTKFVYFIQEIRVKPFEQLNQMSFPQIKQKFICVNCDTNILGSYGDLVKCPECGINFIAKNLAE